MRSVTQEFPHEEGAAPAASSEATGAAVRRPPPRLDGRARGRCAPACCDQKRLACARCEKVVAPACP